LKPFACAWKGCDFRASRPDNLERHGRASDDWSPLRSHILPIIFPFAECELGCRWHHRSHWRARRASQPAVSPRW
jgi:hypothetical protein